MSENTGNCHEWFEFQALDKAPEPPPFPTDALPESLASVVRKVAQAKQVPEAYVATTMLGVLALACQGSHSVYLKDDWEPEGLNLYVMTGMPSATNKSSTLSLLTKPIREYEEHLRREASPQVDRDQAERVEFEAIKKEAEKKLRNAQGSEREKWRASLEEAIERLRRKPLVLPQLFTSYATPESICDLLEKQNERLGIITSEGDEVISHFTGRYGDGGKSHDAKFGILLDGWDGGSSRNGRKTTASHNLQGPRLSMILATQPCTLEGLRKRNGQLDARGALGRILYCLPHASPADMQLLFGNKMPLAEVAYWEDLVGALLRLPKTLPGACPLLRISADACSAFTDFYNSIRHRMEFGADLSHMTAWAGKSRSHCLRIAGLLHLVMRRDPEFVGAPSEIGLQAMSSAVDVMEFFTSHALATWALAGRDETTTKALCLWDYAVRNAADDGCFKRIKKRDLHNAARGRAEWFGSVDKMVPFLTPLIANGYLCELEPTDAQPRVGRPPSPVYELRPEAVAHWEKRHLRR